REDDPLASAERGGERGHEGLGHRRLPTICAMRAPWARRATRSFSAITRSRSRGATGPSSCAAWWRTSSAPPRGSPSGACAAPRRGCSSRPPTRPPGPPCATPARVAGAVDIRPGRAFFSLGRLPGAGGLPVATSGRVLALLSGGSDSPVAAWRMMRRGCRVDLVHFPSVPFRDRTSQEKARELGRLLAAWGLEADLYLVPFGEVQRQIVAAVGRPLRVVLYRRMMLRIAEALARRAGAEALVTGDSLGQVASQTLANLAVVGEAAALPVLRPLVGMDKSEIAAEAARIGTFETSIIPDQDCCTLFTP